MWRRCAAWAPKGGAGCSTDGFSAASRVAKGRRDLGRFRKVASGKQPLQIGVVQRAPLPRRQVAQRQSADALVETLGLDGVLQVASFHPGYQFAGSAPDDVENFTNRSPYPTLHLLREDSVSRAVAAFPDPEVIVERNVETLRQLGVEGWRKLLG